MSENFEELVESYRKDLDLKANDEDLITAIETAMKESQDVKDLIDEIGRKNKLLWQQGSGEDFTRFHPKKSQVVTNRIFSDVETSIPILTAQTPEPTIINAPNNAVKEKLHKALNVAYEVKYKFQGILQKMVRHWYLNRIGILKYRWDEDKGFVTKNILAKKVGFDKTAESLEDSEFVWEIVETTVEKLIDLVPNKKNEILQATGTKDDNALKSKVNYVEFWGGNAEWYVWKLDNIILKKKKNPNFDYGEKAQEAKEAIGEELDDAGKVLQEQQDAVEAVSATEGNNVFSRPKFPYLILTVFALGDDLGVYDDTSLIEEASSLQIDANQTKRQISDLNEGQKRVWLGSAQAISEKQFKQLVDKTGDLGVYMDKNAPEGALQKVQSGKPDASLFNNLQHSLNEIDNIMGTHSTTRGERSESETLGGRKLLKASDTGRQDLIVRNIEQVLEEWYLAYLQMLKVYEDETEVLDDGKEKIEIDPQIIPDNVVVMVKKGSTLPIDDATRFEQAIELAGANLIDPATLYEEMGYANPERRQQRLLPWLRLLGVIQAPQDQQAQQGAPTEGGGQVAGGQPQDAGLQVKEEQMKRLGQMIKVIKQLPDDDEQKKQLINQARQIIQLIKQ